MARTRTGSAKGKAPTAKRKATPAKGGASTSKGKATSIEPLLRDLAARMNRATKAGEQHSIRIQLLGEGSGVWGIETVKGEVRLTRGAGPSNPTLEVIAKSAVIRAILDGKKDGRAAFLAGGIRVRGDIAAAERLSAAMGTHKPSSSGD